MMTNLVIILVLLLTPQCLWAQVGANNAACYSDITGSKLKECVLQPTAYLDQAVKTASSVTFANASITSLSISQIPFAGTSGLLTGNNALTWDSANNIVYAQDIKTKGSCKDVRAYGAVGDGVTDDSTSIQSAMNAAANGCVFIPTGTYVVNNATLQQGAGELTIKGDGWSSIIKGSANPLIARHTAVASTLRVQNLKLYTTSTNTALKMYSYGTANNIPRFFVSDVYFYGGYSSPSDGPIFIDELNCIFADIQNSYFESAGSSFSTATGIRIKAETPYQTDNIKISNCTFTFLKYGVLVDASANTDIRNEGTSINDCLFLGVWYAVQFIRSNGNTINGGMIDNCVRPLLIDSSDNTFITGIWIHGRGQTTIEVKGTYKYSSGIFISGSSIGGYNIEETYLYAIDLNGSADNNIANVFMSNIHIGTGATSGIRMNYVNKMFINNVAFDGAGYAIQEINAIDGSLRTNIGLIDLGATLGISATTVGTKLLSSFTGFLRANSGIVSASALVDSDIPDTVTLTNITQITTRSHTSLSDIGSLSHATIDGYLDQAVKTTSSPNFAALGIGVTPSVPLDVLSDAGVARLVQFTGGNVNTNTPLLVTRGARGNVSSPSAVQATDPIGAFLFDGYTSTGWQGNLAAGVRAYANENFTASAKGSYLTLESTPDGSATRAIVMKISGAGTIINIGGSLYTLGLSGSTVTATAYP